MPNRAIAYSPFWRIVAGVLVVISRASLLAIVGAMLFLDTRLDNQLRLLRVFVTTSLAPALAAWLLARAFSAVVVVAGGTLVVRRRDQQIEIPCEAIAGVEPWSVPLPSAGVWLRLRSGRRFQYGLAVADPIALIDAVTDAGAPDVVRVAARHPAAVYGRSRRDAALRWRDVLLKFVVLALVPAVPLFRLHQWIAYGDTFGEFYTYGVQAYVLGFAMYWSAFTIYLVLYAAVLRVVAEAVVIAVAWAAPARTAGARRVVEWLDRLLYFAGIPAFLLRLAWLST
ncbi:MAG: hypothetical protein ABIR79_22175 [Candidatus Binatia bacterium]